MVPPMGWPFVVKKCLSCGEGPPKRYRARGLCTSCHPYHQTNGTLHHFREIPDDLQDGKLAALKSDPRRYVISVLGKTYADRFDDDTIGAEAVRVFKVTRDRWYRRVAYIEDPRPSAEDFVYAQSGATDYLQHDDDRPAVTPAQDEEPDLTPLEVFRKLWDAPVALVARRFPELGQATYEEEADAWVIHWGDKYRFVRLTVPKGDKLRAQLNYQYELLEYASSPYTQAKLVRFAYSLANPPTYELSGDDVW